MLLVLLIVALLAPYGVPSGAGAAGDDRPLRYLGSEPSTLDPAFANDAATVQLHLQLYAGLTRLDEALEPYPSLAESWAVSNDGRTYEFRLRDALRFSDGSPLDATDVRRSWLRLLNPADGAPGAAILSDVEGAELYAAGQVAEDDVGLEVPDPRTLVVRLEHPAGYFAALVAMPATFVVPRTATDGAGWMNADPFVGSGPYVLEPSTPESLTLRGNPHYVAGAPSIDEVTVVTALPDSDPVTAFSDDELDLAPVASWDAAWMRYDEALGRNLHRAGALTVDYLAFDTAEPPFDDPRVRRAFALTLDRPRLVELAAGRSAEAASSLVPPSLWPDGMRPDPPADPDEARRLLVEAGYTDGSDLGPLTVSVGGYASEGAVATWEEQLGVDLVLESMEFEAYFDRLAEDPPAIFSVSWVVDYPSPQALYSLLLTPTAESNYSRWDDPRFVELLDAAAAAETEAEQAEGYLAVEAYVDEQVPVLPMAYGEDWWLVRGGLRGAGSLTIGLFDFGRLSWTE